MENVPSTQSAYIVSHLRYSGCSPFGVRSGNEGDDGMLYVGCGCGAVFKMTGVEWRDVLHDLRRLIHSG